jgi:hypothetical protein
VHQLWLMTADENAAGMAPKVRAAATSPTLMCKFLHGCTGLRIQQRLGCPGL